MTWTIHTGDCREWLATLPLNSVDAIVTDPPYELGFMGKAWDRSGIAFNHEVWVACLHVLKPGGHLLAFSGTRTYHRMVCAIEDSGFEIRDQLAWMYGTGFPKSLDVSKAIAALRGRWIPEPDPSHWQGWGTALKPAQEPIVLARKPLEGTVAANVLAHGTGGINVDACRIGTSGGTQGTDYAKTGLFGIGGKATITQLDAGRWPANVLLDETAAAMLDEQSGTGTSPPPRSRNQAGRRGQLSKGDENPRIGEMQGYADTGGASRFFYVAKASKAEREAGLLHLPVRSGGELTDRQDGSAALNCPRTGAGRGGGRRNTHPTVKPIALMRYLCRLITPPGGLVVDPFTGSGTTGIAAILEGFSFAGCELDPRHVSIARGRLRHFSDNPGDADILAEENERIAACGGQMGFRW